MIMKKHRLFFVVGFILLLTFGSASAQTPASQFEQGQTTGGYNQITYLKRHYLCRQGEDMNVVDVDLEWPECLNGSLADSLQAHLQRAAFSCQSPRWQDALGQFVVRYGQEVKGQLTTLPDDDKFCYVSCEVKELGLWKGKFATFEVLVSVDPHKNSSQKKVLRHEFISFDLQRNELLKREDVLRISRITGNASASQQFSQLLLAHTSPELTVLPSSISLEAQVGVGNEHLIIPYVAFDGSLDNAAECVAYVPLAQLGEFVTKDFQKRLAVEPRVGSLPGDAKMLDDTGICKSPTSTPKLLLPGYRSIPAYLASHVTIPEAAKAEMPAGRVLASFVVGQEGSVGDVSLLRSASPSIDREVVKAIRLMPRLQPAVKDGKPVKVRLFVPIVLKL